MMPEKPQAMYPKEPGPVTAEPLVSVAVINHNYSQYVCEAIDSVLNQTYRNIEVLVVDDGSTDGSVDLIRNTYGDSVELVTQKNMGVVATRNKVLGLAEGDYLIQLDADDYLDADYVRKAVNAATESRANIVYCQVKYFGRVNFDSLYPQYNLEKLKHENYIGAYAMISVPYLRQSGVKYDSYLNGVGYEDWDFALGLCLTGASPVLLDEPLYYYRKHENADSRNDQQEADLLKLLLVRHHIWQKYNAQYPDEFRYFSAEIDLLLNTIHSLEEKERTVRESIAFTESVYASLQWKIGGAILAPVRYMRRLLGKAK